TGLVDQFGRTERLEQVTKQDTKNKDGEPKQSLCVLSKKCLEIQLLLFASDCSPPLEEGDHHDCKPQFAEEAVFEERRPEQFATPAEVVSRPIHFQHQLLFGKTDVHYLHNTLHFLFVWLWLFLFCLGLLLR